MNGGRRIPMVRPPRQASGGGLGAPSYGNSGAPGQPALERGQRARDETKLRYALGRGRFFERVFVFPDFAALAAGGTPQDTQNIDVKSNGDSFVRLVAIRGAFDTDANLTGKEGAELFLTLGIDGLEDLMTSGRTVQPASFAILFSESAAPWFWFAAPPLIRVGETLAATIRTTYSVSESTITPQLAVRLMDDNEWCKLYGS
jgi:hypothetical protein